MPHLEPDLADDLISFVNASPTPWHAVTETVRRLTAAGFHELKEADAWSITPGDKVFVIRGGSTIAAVEVGHSAPDATGFRLVGAHTDSPNLRIKPNAALKRHGQHQVAVSDHVAVRPGRSNRLGRGK